MAVKLAGLMSGALAAAMRQFVLAGLPTTWLLDQYWNLVRYGGVKWSYAGLDVLVGVLVHGLADGGEDGAVVLNRSIVTRDIGDDVIRDIGDDVTCRTQTKATPNNTQCPPIQPSAP